MDRGTIPRGGLGQRTRDANASGKAREAQAMRIATEPSADLSRIEIVDLMKAIGRA
jgi:hypothetical protein